MNYHEIEVDTVVCLLCGAKVGVDDLEIVDINDLDVPEEVKAKGAFFQAVACPKCKKSIFLGFIASVDEAEPEKEVIYDHGNKNAIVDVEVTDVSDDMPADDDIQLENEGSKEQAAEDEVPRKKTTKKKTAKKRRKKKVKKGEAPPEKHKPNRLKRQKAQCGQCGEWFDVGVDGVGGFGTKCKKCLNALVRKYAP
jgi:hypothetical protein